MSKTSIVTVVALVLVGAIVAVVVLRPLSGGAGVVTDLSEAFMEDLQFKDFRKSALYHHATDQGRIDIGRALEELFKVPPEFLDIVDYRIRKAEVDSTGERARVVVNTRFKILNKDKKPREREIILYWLKRHPDCPLGGECIASTCKDERGEPMYGKLNNDEEGVRRTKNRDNKVAPKLDDEPVACDVTAEKRWFMNLDSTLKQKDYRDE